MQTHYNIYLYISKTRVSPCNTKLRHVFFHRGVGWHKLKCRHLAMSTKSWYCLLVEMTVTVAGDRTCRYAYGLTQVYAGTPQLCYCWISVEHVYVCIVRTVITER